MEQVTQKEVFYSSLQEGLKWGAALAFFGGSFFFPVGGHVPVPILVFPGFLLLSLLLLRTLKKHKRR